MVFFLYLGLFFCAINLRATGTLLQHPFFLHLVSVPPSFPSPPGCLKVYYLFLTDQQKAFPILMSLLSFNVHQLLCDEFARQVAVLIFPFSTDASKYLPLYTKARFPIIFSCFLDHFIKVAVPVHLPK